MGRSGVGWGGVGGVGLGWGGVGLGGGGGAGGRGFWQEAVCVKNNKPCGEFVSFRCGGWAKCWPLAKFTCHLTKEEPIVRMAAQS